MLDGVEVRASQVLPHQTHPTMPLWILLCAHGNRQTRTENYLPQFFPKKKEAQNCLNRSWYAEALRFPFTGSYTMELFFSGVGPGRDQPQKNNPIALSLLHQTLQLTLHICGNGTEWNTWFQCLRSVSQNLCLYSVSSLSYFLVIHQLMCTILLTNLQWARVTFVKPGSTLNPERL